MSRNATSCVDWRVEDQFRGKKLKFPTTEKKMTATTTCCVECDFPLSGSEPRLYCFVLKNVIHMLIHLYHLKSDSSYLKHLELGEKNSTLDESKNIKTGYKKNAYSLNVLILCK